MRKLKKKEVDEEESPCVDEGEDENLTGEIELL